MIKSNNLPLQQFLAERTNRINAVLARYLDFPSASAANLCAAMSYSVMNGGKRLRPVLVYAVGEAYGADLNILDAPAAAIELMHAFSLIHDDLPVMDNDDLRRGKPTCHKAFDEATAILAGDALAILPMQILSASDLLTAKQAIAMINVLATATGVQGMIAGQAMDIAATGSQLSIDKLEETYKLKTSALLEAATKLGAIAADATAKETENLTLFAYNLGLAFQIQDDILNIESDSKKLGKNVGTDKAQNKLTYPAIVGIDVAKEKVQALGIAARNSLQQLNIDISLLLALTDYILTRDF